MKYILLFLIFYSALSNSQECPKVSNELLAAIEKHASIVRGSEYCEAREVYENKGREFVLYVIEGPCFHEEWTPGSCGNVTYTYLSGVLNGKLLAPLEVGVRGTYYAEAMLVSESSIVIEGFEYTETDAQCCPSLPKRKVLKISELEFSR